MLKCYCIALDFQLPLNLFDFENFSPGFLTIFPGLKFSKSNKKNLKAYLKILPGQILLNGP